MHGVDHQQLLRRDLIGRKSEAARRRERSVDFPLFGPGAQRLQATGDRDFLRHVLTFPGWEVRTHINFEPTERLNGDARMREITHLLHSNNVGIQPRNVGVHRVDLPSFFRGCRIRTVSRKPLNVPESDCNPTRGRRWRGQARLRRKRPRAWLGKEV